MTNPEILYDYSRPTHQQLIVSARSSSARAETVAIARAQDILVRHELREAGGPQRTRNASPICKCGRQRCVCKFCSRRSSTNGTCIRTVPSPSSCKCCSRVRNTATYSHPSLEKFDCTDDLEFLARLWWYCGSSNWVTPAGRRACWRPEAESVSPSSPICSSRSSPPLSLHRSGPSTSPQSLWRTPAASNRTWECRIRRLRGIYMSLAPSASPPGVPLGCCAGSWGHALSCARSASRVRPRTAERTWIRIGGCLNSLPRSSWRADLAACRRWHRSTSTADRRDTHARWRAPQRPPSSRTWMRTHDSRTAAQDRTRSDPSRWSSSISRGGTDAGTPGWRCVRLEPRPPCGQVDRDTPSAGDASVQPLCGTRRRLHGRRRHLLALPCSLNPAQRSRWIM